MICLKDRFYGYGYVVVMVMLWLRYKREGVKGRIPVLVSTETILYALYNGHIKTALYQKVEVIITKITKITLNTSLRSFRFVESVDRLLRTGKAKIV